MAVTAQTLLDLQDANRTRLARLAELDKAVRGQFELPYLPLEGQSRLITEYNALIKRAETPILAMLVSAQVDRLRVVGVRSSAEDTTPNDEVWLWWQLSRFDQAQSMLYRDSANYGDGFAVATVGSDGLPRFSVESPLNMCVEYDEFDPLRLVVAAKFAGDVAYLWDAEAYWRFERNDRNVTGWELVKETPHAAGVCPVVRFPNNLDSCGRSVPEIEPVLPIQARVNQGLFDRLLVQRSQSWRQRWATGLDIERDADGNPIAPFETGADTLLVNESPDGRFGEFLQANIDPLLKAIDSDIAAAAMVTRTPPHYLPQATISSVSAEALVALEGAFTSKISEKQLILGQSHKELAETGAALIGQSLPVTSEVVWADLEMRSLAQKVDAAVKKRSIGVPMTVVLSDLGYTDAAIQRMLPQIEQEQMAAANAQAAAFGVVPTDAVE